MTKVTSLRDAILMKDYLLCIAGSDIDYFYTTEKFLSPGDACLCVPEEPKAGGCILNVAVAAANKGIESRVTDHLRSNDTGTELIIDTLSDKGVITSDILTSEDVTNGSCIIFKKGDEKCIYVIDPKHPPFKMNEHLSELLKNAKYIYTLPRILSFCFEDLHFISDLRNNGTKIFFDGSSQYLDPSEAEIIRKYGDGLFINTQSYQRLLDALKGAELKLDFICLTDGDKGADCITASQSFHQDAYKVKVKDSTGAGDSFAGTFIACLNQNYDYPKALRYACAGGAMACEKSGGMCSTFSLEDIEQFLSNRNR